MFQIVEVYAFLSFLANRTLQTACRQYIFSTVRMPNYYNVTASFWHYLKLTVSQKHVKEKSQVYKCRLASNNDTKP